MEGRAESDVGDWTKNEAVLRPQDRSREILWGSVSQSIKRSKALLRQLEQPDCRQALLFIG